MKNKKIEPRKKMDKKKIGIVVIVSILALSVINVSYAGLTENIRTPVPVTLIIEDYSGTDVWKVYGPNAPLNEIVIWHGFISDPSRPTKESLETLYPECTALLISSSWAKKGTTYDVDIDINNIFPCIEFISDIIIHYTGSNTICIALSEMQWLGFDFNQYTTIEAYSYTLENGLWIKGEILEFPVEMNYCEYVGIEVNINLESNNDLQSLLGDFSFDILQYDCSG